MPTNVCSMKFSGDSSPENVTRSSSCFVTVTGIAFSISKAYPAKYSHLLGPGSRVVCCTNPG